MAKIDQMVSALQKLYVKRNAIDKQIVNAERKLAAEAKVAAKPVKVKKLAAKAKKPAARKPAKPEAPKIIVAKPLLKK